MELGKIIPKNRKILGALGIGKSAPAAAKIDEGVRIERLPADHQLIDEYYIHEPNSKVKIVSSPNLGEGLHYFVEESPLTEDQYKTYQKIVSILSKEFESPKDEELSPKEYVFEQAEIIAEKYHRSLGKFTQEEWDKIFYYVVRDLIGYGPLQAIMEDPHIEDISCNGLDVPIYIWHRKYESIPTNIIFTGEQELNDFIVSLAHKSSKHISSAQPVLDAMLPEKHRLAATFMNEVSTKGSTFCIRKFSSDPFSIVDMINIGTLNAKIAAYFWLILENKRSFMIIGGTGAGKTSMLNALLSLMSQNDKVVTVEEVPELSPPVSNWTQLNSRENFSFGEGTVANITLFDLIKVSLRYRPDYVIVGEVRGEEAYVLFQALATGHGGLCTMHADSLDRVVKRLTSPPMNVSEVYIPLMNLALYIQRVELPSEREGMTFGRRIRNVSEIVEYDNYLEVATWNPINDTFETHFEKSYQLRQIAQKNGMTMEEILEELNRREKFIEEIARIGIREQRKVAQRILSYYNRKRDERRIERTKPSKLEMMDDKKINESKREEKDLKIEVEDKEELIIKLIKRAVNESKIHSEFRKEEAKKGDLKNINKKDKMEPIDGSVDDGLKTIVINHTRNSLETYNGRLREIKKRITENLGEIVFHLTKRGHAFHHVAKLSGGVETGT